jgi:hypothetical protein
VATGPAATSVASCTSRRDGTAGRSCGAIDRDLAALHERAAGVEPVVRQERRPRAVAEAVQVAGVRVLLRVRGHRRGEPAAEVARAEHAQLAVDLDRQRVLDQGEQPARVVQHGGVGLAVGVDPAVAVPLGAPVAQPHAVDHAAAHEPVRGEVARARVGPVAEVPPDELER